jgi:hypothetical protein
MMDGEPLMEYHNKGIEDIARNMGVERPDVSLLYEDMKETAADFLEIIDSENLSPEEFHERFQRQLADMIAPYASNPAYQAFLERKYAIRTGKEL